MLPVCNKLVIAIESNGFTKILMHNLHAQFELYILLLFKPTMYTML
jgi:hypothetical protein